MRNQVPVEAQGIGCRELEVQAVVTSQSLKQQYVFLSSKPTLQLLLLSYYSKLCFLFVSFNACSY